MVSEKFRRELREETEQWWTEGLIDANLYEKLAQRYQFQDLEQSASNRFIAILITLGSILLGLGVITFVAANWQDWSRLVKVILLMGVFLGVNIVGFYLWQQPRSKGVHRLGYGLLLLGGLLLGANLALMSQLFHQSGEMYELFLLWGFGVTVMAYSLRLTPLGVLAWILVLIGYLWGGEFLLQDSWETPIILQHMPLITSLVFLPLAYWCRSRTIFTLSALLIMISLMVIGIKLNFPLFAFVLPPVLFWGYDHLFPGHTLTSSFGTIARRLTLILLSIVFYLFSFHGETSSLSNSSASWFLLLDSIILGGVAGFCWFRMGNPFKVRHFQEGWINNATIAFSLIVSGLMFYSDGRHGFFSVLVFNILLFLLAIGLIRDGLAQGNRSAFWGGMILLVLGIISRTLEYDNGLLLKSLVLLLCGLAVILFGLRFEQRLKSHRSSSLSNFSGEEP